MSTESLQPADCTVVCHVRAPLLLEPIDAKIETLQTCADRSDIDGLIIRSWPSEVTLGESETGDYQEILDRYEQFEQWADYRGVSIRPPFAIKSRQSLVRDDEQDVLVTPTLCLALYTETSLIGVYPHTASDHTVTATDAVAALRTGELPPLLGTATRDEAIVTDETVTTDTVQLVGRDSREQFTEILTTSCPHCQSDLGNVQGILACVSCNWTDTVLDEIESAEAKLVYLTLLDGPVSIEELKTACALKKISLYGILQSLSRNGLVIKVGPETYRAQRTDSTKTVDHSGTELEQSM